MAQQQPDGSDELKNDYHKLPNQPRRPFGTVPKYRQNYALTAYNVLARGDSVHHVCAVLDITEQTLVSWMRAHLDFEDAVRRGLEVGGAKWAKLGQLGIGMGKLFNANLYIFQMQNRYGWGRAGSDLPPAHARLPRPVDRAADEQVEQINAAQAQADADRAAELLVAAISARLTGQKQPDGPAIIDIPATPPATPTVEDLPEQEAMAEVMPDRTRLVGEARRRYDDRLKKLPSEILDIVGHPPEYARGATDDEDEDDE